jgi:catechol 2,3-dioxygenase-like lactoylglutathione lyase family enzyme
VETLIDGLLKRYETGSLSRRQLIRGLALMAGAGAAGASASAAGFEPSGVNHVSLYVSNLQRSVDFYVKTFDGTITLQDKESVRVKFGKTGNDHFALREGTPPTKVDHVALGINDFNREAVTATLKERGVTPEQTPEFGFHVKDPDGFPVQMVATMPG